MIQWMFHKELSLVQDKVLTDKCWSSHRELHTESSLLFMKNQGWFYQVDPLELLVLVNLIGQGL